MMNAAESMVEQFCTLGVEVVFTVSGNQNLPLLAAFEGGGVRLIHARHE